MGNSAAHEAHPGMAEGLRNTESTTASSPLEGIIHSMTTAERRDPSSRRLPSPPHRHRAGVTTSEVNALLKQFGEMQKMMKGLGGGLLGRSMGKKTKKKGKGGGRTTPKGGAKPKLTLPPPSDAGSPGGFRLPGL